MSTDEHQQTAHAARDLFKRYEEALNTIAQLHCVCEEVTDSYYEDDYECGSCIANRTLDGLKRGEGT